MIASNLIEKYRPQTLADVVGQPTAQLHRIVAAPVPCCVLLEGATGTGKSAAAHALANDLGAWKDPMLGVFGPTVVSGPDFNAAKVRELFGEGSHFRYRRQGWHVLIVEELEYLHAQTQDLAKDILERQVARWQLVVIATSNDTTGLKTSLRDRFDQYQFGCGEPFATACYDRLTWIWEQESPQPLPRDWRTWGWEVEGAVPRFSMRRALRMMQRFLRF